MNRTAFLCLVLVLFLSGCALVLPGPEPTPLPTPDPTPTPAPMIVVCGGAKDGGFCAMVQAVADSAACQYRYIDPKALDTFLPEGRAVLILCQAAETEPISVPAALSERLRGLYAYTEGSGDGLVYDPVQAPFLALNEAIAFDNHDTPVRLMALLTSENSPAAAVWTAAIANGRILDKGVYHTADTESTASDWLKKRLSDMYPGMLDGLYCETAALSLTAAETLRTLERDDIEIFSATVDDALLNAMQEHPRPIVCALGANPAEAGRLAAEQALVLLYGGRPQQLTLNPTVFSSD